jgi:hypothetical protein
MRNIGPVSREWLYRIGVRDLEDLRQVGAVRAYRLIRAQQPKATRNLLWALEGALRGCDWRALPEARKRQLLREAGTGAA